MQIQNDAPTVVEYIPRGGLVTVSPHRRIPYSHPHHLNLIARGGLLGSSTLAELPISWTRAGRKLLDINPIPRDGLIVPRTTESRRRE